MRYTRLASLARYDSNRAVAAEGLHGLERYSNGAIERHGIQRQGEKRVSIEHEHLLVLAFFQRQADAAAGAQRGLFHGKIVTERPGVRLHKGHHLFL